ncbi:unnamed protein product [Rhizoctonia solani]|uniref:Fungal-type protein kinase domain-containing protein n=1 Tax=Rhizoctonia solani TaxID=456999 RepID=A0A8H3E1T5_9AGAM|nr:unnamed protein product [Rhizoctonia solani]
MSISYPFSNPIKQGSCPVETLLPEETYEDLRGQRVVQDVLPAKFLQNYFQECSHSSMDWSPTELGLISTIRLFKHRPERGLYTDDAPLLHLLNSISRRIFESRDEDRYALVFRSAHKRPIHSPFTMHSHTPEIVVIWERSEVFPQIDYTQDDLIPQTWCAFAAVGEVESSSNGKYQLGVYLKNLLQLHPELNAVLGLTAKYNGYALLYHDASVIHRSSFDWGEPGPLFAFVEKLYTRPFQDTSMQLVAPQYRDMTWAIRIGDQVYLTEASRCLAGPGQRRYTTTAIDLTTSERVFIKDIWRDARRVFFETLLFEKAHKGEPLPGLMLVDSHGYVLDETQNRLSTASHQISPGGERYKMRMITKEVGRPLETIRSLRHFLCLMYDACAVQRNLYRKCQILHRDISTGNIMIAPTTDQYWERCKNGFAEVKFVNQVLEEDGKTSNPQPTCLLIDLGNGTDLNATRDNNQLRQRTASYNICSMDR